ncbi:MAG: FadR/GntR family transcriptional regulator [Acetobacteraceae bacterium]
MTALADLIMRRVWRPGDRIPPEKELAAQFKVGRSTVREAVKSLVLLGVIEARPGDGSFIRGADSALLSGAFHWGLLLTERNLGDLVDARVLIEGECAARAALLADPSLAPKLMTMVDQMRFPRRDLAKFMQLDRQFHTAIAAASQNALYSSLCSTIQSLVNVWYLQTLHLPITRAVTIEEHSKITAAIKLKDVDAAREAMQQHILCAAKRLQRVLEAAHRTKGLR